MDHQSYSGDIRTEAPSYHTSADHIEANPRPSNMYGMDIKSADQKVTATSDDIELGEVTSVSPSPEEHVKKEEEEEESSSSKIGRFYHKYKIWFDLAGWLIITGWCVVFLQLSTFQHY